MNDRGTDIKDNGFMASMAEWFNSRDAIWLREQMIEDNMRCRGRNCKRLAYALEHYFPLCKGSVHLCDSTANHYSMPKTKPRGGWESAPEVLQLDRTMQWPGLGVCVTPGATAKTR